VTPRKHTRHIARAILLVLGLTSTAAIVNIRPAAAEAYCVEAYAQPGTGATVCTPWD
jgi:hypothetical protein